MANHQAAFDLVCPAQHARALAEVGLISPEAADSHDWRSEIAAIVTVDELASAGVDLIGVIDAIEFFTGAAPKVEVVKKVGSTPFVCWLPGHEPRGFLFLSTGYRKGPAGP